MNGENGKHDLLIGAADKAVALLSNWMEKDPNPGPTVGIPLMQAFITASTNIYMADKVALGNQALIQRLDRLIEILERAHNERPDEARDQ